MTKKQVETIIESGIKKGYRVAFNKIVGLNKKEADFFPAINENLFKTEKEALDIAKKLAEKTQGLFVNFVIIDEKFKEVNRSNRITN